MSNQYRLEQDRDLILLIDAGRLSRAPLQNATILDAELDAASALAFVADELGDRTGAVAFDDDVRVALTPQRRGGQTVVRALYDLEASTADSDFELAFRRAEGSKRALVVVLCDLLEEAAARPLVRAVPVLTRRHAVVVASPSDPVLEALAKGGGDRLTDATGDRRRRRPPGASARRGSGPRGGRARHRSAAGPATGNARRDLPAREVARDPLSHTSAPEQGHQREAEPGLEPHGQLGTRREAFQHAAQHEPRHRARGHLDGRDRLAPQATSRGAARPAGSAPSPSAVPRSRPRRCTRSPAARGRR